MKKFLSKLLMLGVVTSIISLSGILIFAQESGVCGDNVTWTLDDNGTLTISGNGAMYDYGELYPVLTQIPNYESMAPWYSSREKINKVVIENGITTIGRAAFIDCDKITEVVISEGVTRIEHFAFSDCNSIEEIYLPDSAVSLGQNAIACGDNLKSISIPSAIEVVGVNAFGNCSTIYYRGSENDFDSLNERDKGEFKYRNVIYINADDNFEKASVLINNQFLQCDQPPVIKNDRTLVPMRAIFEALGAEVSWNDETKTAEGVKDGKKVAVTIDENAIAINDEKHEIDVPAQLIHDRTMVPVRAISEAFDCIVNWNGMKNYVIIIPKNQTPYKINVDVNGENIATVYYNDMGLLSRITYSTEDADTVRVALMPFYLNMNGNAYFDIFWKRVFRGDSDGIINFNYSSDKLSSIECNNNSTNYTYNDDNSLKGNIGTGGDFDYSGYPIVSRGKETYDFNEDGLLSETDMQQSGGRQSFTYENGNLTSASASYYSITFNYDEQNLSSASYRETGKMSNNISYQYSDDV